MLRETNQEIREADESQSEIQKAQTTELNEEIVHVLGQSRFDYEEWLKSAVGDGKAIMVGIDPRTT